MAKLSSLKLRNDENNRQIKCLIVEDYRNGNISKHFEHKEFERIIETTDPMFLTKVYSPSTKDKESIYELIDKNTSEKDGKQVVNIPEHEMVFTLMSKYTDLEFDVNDTQEIYNNPNDLFIAIKGEMDKLLISLIESYVETYNTLQSNPQTVDLMTQSIKADKIKNKEKEIEELKARIEELSGE